MSEEIKNAVRELIEVRVSGVLSAGGIREAIDLAVRKKTAELLAESKAQMTELLKVEIRLQVKSFVDHAAPALFRESLPSIVRSIVDVGAAVREEIRAMAAADLGHQIATRMRRFFAAVDANLAKEG